MEFSPKKVFHEMAEAGATLQKTLHQIASSPYDTKQLQPVGIEKAARMVGCTGNHIRALEKRGEIPPPETVRSGSIQRRVYSLRDVNRIREVTGHLPARPDGSKCITVVFSNLKGGVAKTTTAVHFAQYASREGYRVLLIDTDPQASATSVFGYVPDLDLDESDTVLDALTEDSSHILNTVRTTYWDRLNLVPSQLNLQNADYILPLPDQNNHAKMGPHGLRLRKAIANVQDAFDIIVVDTPPALGMLSINSILAADYLVVPITPYMYDIASSVQYFRILDELSGIHELQARKLNILITRHDGSRDSTSATRMLTGAYGEYVLSTHMMQTAELKKSSSDMLSVYEIDVPRGSSETYKRAIMLLDAVNHELLANVQELWEKEAARLVQPEPVKARTAEG